MPYTQTKLQRLKSSLRTSISPLVSSAILAQGWQVALDTTADLPLTPFKVYLEQSPDTILKPYEAYKTLALETSRTLSGLSKA